MAVFTSDSVDRLNNIDDRKIRSYLYKLNEDLTYMFNNLTPEDNYSEMARLVYIQDRENYARFEVRADRIDLEISKNTEQISKLSLEADRVSASVTDVKNNYDASMKLLANMFSLKVSTPSGSSSAVLSGDKITLTTGKFTVNAKNLTIDENGNATFSGRVAGATIYGGSINIGDGFFEVDDQGIILGDFFVSADSSNRLVASDGSFALTTASTPAGGVAELSIGNKTNQTTILGGNISASGTLYCKVVYDTGKSISNFYDIQLGKSWWKGWTITETVQDLWEQVDSLSDRTAKYNILNIDPDEATKFILQSNPVTFQYKKNGEWSAGMIAQEVEELEDMLSIYYPLVKTDKKSGKYRIEYRAYIPLLVATVQNLQEQINTLREEKNESNG